MTWSSAKCHVLRVAQVGSPRLRLAEEDIQDSEHVQYLAVTVSQEADTEKTSATRCDASHVQLKKHCDIGLTRSVVPPKAVLHLCRVLVLPMA